MSGLLRRSCGPIARRRSWILPLVSDFSGSMSAVNSLEDALDGFPGVLGNIISGVKMNSKSSSSKYGCNVGCGGWKARRLFKGAKQVAENKLESYQWKVNIDSMLGVMVSSPSLN